MIRAVSDYSGDAMDRENAIGVVETQSKEDKHMSGWYKVKLVGLSDQIQSHEYWAPDTTFTTHAKQGEFRPLAPGQRVQIGFHDNHAMQPFIGSTYSSAGNPRDDSVEAMNGVDSTFNSLPPPAVGYDRHVYLKRPINTDANYFKHVVQLQEAKLPYDG